MRTRAATVDDIGQIMEIISQAKAQMRRLGSGQWTDDYPSHQHIAKDISDGHGYVMTDDDGVVAYMAISFDGEPAYARHVRRENTIRHRPSSRRSRQSQKTRYSHRTNAGSGKDSQRGRHNAIESRHQLRQRLHATSIRNTPIHLSRESRLP